MVNCLIWFEVRLVIDDVYIVVVVIICFFVVGNVLELVLVGVRDGWVKVIMNVFDFFERSKIVLEFVLG